MDDRLLIATNIFQIMLQNTYIKLTDYDEIMDKCFNTADQLIYKNEKFKEKVKKETQKGSDKLHCLYCGAEIVLRIVTKVNPSYWHDIAEHCMSCPAGSTRVVFRIKQEAIDAYSMKWEG